MRRGLPAHGRLHPAQKEALFAGLEPATGALAVASVNTFIDRYEQLRARTLTGDAAGDKAAAVTLEQRHIIDPEVVAEMRALIATATALADAPQRLRQTGGHSESCVVGESGGGGLLPGLLR